MQLVKSCKLHPSVLPSIHSQHHLPIHSDPVTFEGRLCLPSDTSYRHIIKCMCCQFSLPVSFSRDSTSCFSLAYPLPLNLSLQNVRFQLRYTTACIINMLFASCHSLNDFLWLWLGWSYEFFPCAVKPQYNKPVGGKARLLHLEVCHSSIWYKSKGLVVN